MKKILLIICLASFLMYSLKAMEIKEQVPFIINGVETEELLPVVKLTIGSQYESQDEGKAICTGTFIKKGYILTAAHCLFTLYEEVFNLDQQFLIKEGKLHFDSFIDITINKESTSRVVSMELHHKVREYLNNKLTFHEKLLDIKRQIQKKEIPLEMARLFIQQELQKIKKFTKNSEYDVAILTVKPEKTDQIFKLSDHELNEGDLITMVGYGHHINVIEVQRLKMLYEGRLQLYMASKAQKEKDEHLREMKKIGKEISKSAGIKRMGLNQLTRANGNTYEVFGFSENKAPYWEEDNPKQLASMIEASVSQGDSGGPLLEKDGDSYLVHGVASTTELTKDENYGAKSTYVNINAPEVRVFLDSILKGKVKK